MKACYIFGQNPFGSSWDIVGLIFSAIFSNGRWQPFWMVDLQKYEIFFLGKEEKIFKNIIKYRSLTCAHFSTTLIKVLEPP